MISFPEENAERLVPLAHEYQMKQLASLCEKFLLQEPPSLSQLVLADKYGLGKLRQVCIEHVKKTNLDTLKKEMMYEQIDPVSKVEILEHHIVILTDRHFFYFFIFFYFLFPLLSWIYTRTSN